MVDIKSSVLFQKKKNNPLDKIKAQNTYNQNQDNQYDMDGNKKNIDINENENTENQDVDHQKHLTKTVRKVIPQKKKKRPSKGAPDTFLDKVFKSTSSVRLSAVVNSTLKLLTEKYMTDKSKDKILREALNVYIVTYLEKDDRILLLKDLEKDLDLFREKNPIVSLTDEDGNILKSKEAIKNETSVILKNGFKLK